MNGGHAPAQNTTYYRLAMPSLPAMPEVPDDQRGETNARLRYEDVSQDGRLLVGALAPFLGPVIWSLVGKHSTTHEVSSHGVIPILTKLMLRGAPGPIAVRPMVQARGRYQLAHSRDAAGEVDKLFMNMWCQVEGPRGRTYGPPPEGRGEAVPVGEIFAEHVFTRLFAPPEARRVRRFELPGIEPVPAARHDFVPPDALLALPAGATWLEPEMTPDEAPVVFGLTHTDSNQHVNSLVYPRLFEEAALRRLDREKHGAKLLCRALDVFYRKPCFAGDRARVLLRLARGADGRLGAIGGFVPEGADRHSVTLAAWFEP
jgi:hypothetical protein